MSDIEQEIRAPAYLLWESGGRAAGKQALADDAEAAELREAEGAGEARGHGEDPSLQRGFQSCKHVTGVSLGMRPPIDQPTETAAAT